ncbi:hypothetical protein PSTT_12939 [Puccinia striiformis]|uniref:Uncharacterized protein n=1 Tax=Puccinia striiformis TaxID=27350 RepID=A0A2S4UTY2_9BASI|nr:hypothetical protein PSTT_12939 [Puccinia striiformis]
MLTSDYLRCVSGISGISWNVGNFLGLDKKSNFTRLGARPYWDFSMLPASGHINTWCTVAPQGGYPHGLVAGIRSLETANSSAQVWMLSIYAIRASSGYQKIRFTMYHLPTAPASKRSIKPLRRLAEAQNLCCYRYLLQKTMHVTSMRYLSDL